MQTAVTSYADERSHSFTVSVVQQRSHLSAVLCLGAVVLLVATALHLSTTSLALLLVVGIAVAAVYTGSQVTSESVTILKGVGVLLTSNRRWFGETSRFLDLQEIHSVIINETLTTTNIHVQLAFILYDSDKLAIAFPDTHPGLSVLVPIYREMQALVPGAMGPFKSCP